MNGLAGCSVSTIGKPYEYFDLTPYTVLRLVAECGDDMRKWPTAKHFTSWLTLAPGNKISGGRVLSSKSRRSSNRAAALFRIAAVNVGRTQTAYSSHRERRIQSKLNSEGSDRDSEKVSSAVLQRRSLRTRLCRSWHRLLRETLSGEGPPQPPASRSSIRLHVGRGGGIESAHRSFLGKALTLHLARGCCAPDFLDRTSPP